METIMNISVGFIFKIHHLAYFNTTIFFGNNFKNMTPSMKIQQQA